MRIMRIMIVTILHCDICTYVCMYKPFNHFYLYFSDFKNKITKIFYSAYSIKAELKERIKKSLQFLV